jgi:FtsH-binding integral membrane protein
MQTKRPRLGLPGQDPGDMFVAKTYGYFVLSLVGMFACGVIGFFLLPVSWLIPFAIADAVLWILCGWFGWRNPIGLVFPVFTIVTGCVLGLTAEQYAKAGAAGTMLSAGIITVIMFTSLSVYALISKRNFSWLLGFLIAGFWILLGGFVLLAFMDFPLFHVALSTFGALVFLCWILFDTSRIVGRWDPDLTPAIGAFELFLDIIGLFSYILDLLDIADN